MSPRASKKYSGKGDHLKEHSHDVPRRCAQDILT